MLQKELNHAEKILPPQDHHRQIWVVFYRRLQSVKNVFLMLRLGVFYGLICAKLTAGLKPEAWPNLIDTPFVIDYNGN